MIKIISQGSGGPAIFLKRLERSLKNSNNLNHSDNIYLSTKNYLPGSNDYFFLRLDGLNFVKYTNKEFSNFINYRWKNKVDFLKYISQKIYNFSPQFYKKMITPRLSKYINRYHNRSEIRAIGNSDLIIFQSNFSKACWEYFHGKDISKDSVIIHNGVDLKQFYPNPSLKNNNELNLVISGNFRIHKRLQEVIRLFSYLIKVIPNSYLNVLGKMDIQTKKLVAKIINKNISVKKRIKFIDYVEFDDLPQFYQKMDIMLHPSWLDPCPNVVVEGLASGLPVVCASTGGTPELVKDGGIIIDEKFSIDFTEYYNYSKIPKLNYKNYIEAIIEINSNIKSYSLKARNRAVNDLDIDKVSKKYLDAFNKICKR